MQLPLKTRFLLSFAIWTALALLSTIQGALWLAHLGEKVRWDYLLLSRFADWYTCAIFTPAFTWLARHYPIDRRGWRIGIPAHVAAISLIVVAKYAALGQVRSWLRPEWRRWDLDTMLASSFISEWIAFGCVVAVVHALEFYQRYREREVQALRLQTQLAQARLDSLTAQLHPHFLFNTLHGISTLMHRDVDAADLMLTRLSDLLRRALRNSDRHEVPLAEELDTLEQYLAIMRVRFEDRLTVTRRVAPNAAQALVPHFLLQPLAENALQHGIARRAGAGHVEVIVDRIGEELHITVSDDGAGMRGASVAPVEGIGLSNTRRRLEELYGPAATLALEEPTGAGAGFRVRLVLPFRPAPASADAA